MAEPRTEPRELGSKIHPLSHHTASLDHMRAYEELHSSPLWQPARACKQGGRVTWWASATGQPPTWSPSGPVFCLSLSGFPPVRTLLSSGIFPISSPKPATTPFLPVICADSGCWRSHHPVNPFIRLSLWKCCVTIPPSSQWLKTTDAYFSSLKISCCLVNLDWAYLIQVG